MHAHMLRHCPDRQQALARQQVNLTAFLSLRLPLPTSAQPSHQARLHIIYMLYVCMQVATLPRIVSKRWPDHGIDVLVNNAGMSRNDASMFEGNVASWVEMLSTNVLGNAMCTRAVLQVCWGRGE